MFTTNGNVSSTVDKKSTLFSPSRRALCLFLVGNMVNKKVSTEQTYTTNFSPLKHGFHFKNSFVNVILDTATMYIATQGRCGGMAYAALDYYFAHMPIPSYRIVNDGSRASYPVAAQKYPTGASILTDYIYTRQIDSMVTLWPFGRVGDFFTYTIANDALLFQWTTQREMPKLRMILDKGCPIPLGLIGEREVSKIAYNHQVVAHACTIDPLTKEFVVSIYDSNYPDTEVTLHIDSVQHCLHASTGKTWRGFFVRDDYWPHTPPDVSRQSL